MSAPASLRSPDMAPFWAAVRDRLERQGSTSRGRLRIPPLSAVGRHCLTSLLGRPLTATVDLGELELALHHVGAGSDLVRALSNVGHAMSFEAEERRKARRLRADAREAVHAIVAQWPEVWAKSWVADVIQAGLLRGLDVEASVSVVGDVRRGRFSRALALRVAVTAVRSALLRNACEHEAPESTAHRFCRLCGVPVGEAEVWRWSKR